MMTVPNIVNEVNKKYRIARNARLKYEKEWKLNLAFYSNRQWVVYDSGYHRVVEWVPSSRKPRATTNLILPVVRIEFSRLTRNKPDFMVVARRADQESVMKARVCRNYLDYRWNYDRLSDVYAAALLWALVCGTGFVKTYWDANAGDVVELADGSRHALGEVMVDYCSPFEILVDPFARDLSEAAWVIHARVRPVEYIEMKYGVKVSAETTDVLGIAWHDVGEKGRVEGTIPSAVVKEYWERPSPKYPRGRYAIIVQNQVLYEGENPYAEICPIPFDMVRHLRIPGRFYGDSVVTHLRQINVLYNKLKSDIIENSAKLSNPPMVAPVNAFFQTPKFEPGEIIYYNPLVPGVDRMRWMEPIPYPPQLVNLLIRLAQEVDNISGITEVSRGMVPRGVRSAQAMAHILEQEEMRASVTAQEYERMIASSLTKMLRLAKEFYDVPRLIQVVGENQSYEARQFKSTDIPEDVEVHVEPNSTLPKSKARIKEELYSLWDRQILTDPRLLLRLTEYGNMNEVFADLELDTAQALRENEKMAKGEEARVEDYQNHAVHIAEHNRYRKTVAYEKLPDQVKELFARHVAEHQQFLAQLQAQQPEKPEKGGAING